MWLEKGEGRGARMYEERNVWEEWNNSGLFMGVGAVSKQREVDKGQYQGWEWEEEAEVWVWVCE